MVHSLSRARWLPFLDMKGGFWRANLKANVQDKLHFMLERGRALMSNTPFGLCKGPRYFSISNIICMCMFYPRNRPFSHVLRGKITFCSVDLSLPLPLHLATNILNLLPVNDFGKNCLQYCK